MKFFIVAMGPDIKPFSLYLPVVQTAHLCMIPCTMKNEIKLSDALGNQNHRIGIVNSVFLSTVEILIFKCVLIYKECVP